MAAVTAEMDLEISKLKSALGRANARIERFAKKGERSGKKLGSGLAKGLKGAFLPALAALGLGAGIGAIFSDALKEAAADEQLSVSMEVLVGDASEATELMDKLRQEAATTPLQFEDIGNAAKKLLAFGSAAATVPDELRKIGDISSGIGAPIGEIAELYGKARVQGTLFAEDINQLTGRGIPVMQEFAKQLGVAESEVKKMGSEGKLTFANLQRAFVDLTSEGGLFANMLEKQAETIAGKWSTLKDGVSLLYLEFGKPIADALKPILDSAIAKIAEMKDKARGVGEFLADGIDFAMAALETMSIGEIFALGGEALKLAFLDSINVLARGIQAIWASAEDAEFMSGLEGQIENLTHALKVGLINALAEAFYAMRDNPLFGDLALEMGSSLAKQADSLDLDREKELKDKPEVSPADLWKDFQSKFAGAKDVYDTQSDRMDFEREVDKIALKADERKQARRKKEEEKDKSSTPSAADIVPSLTSRGGLGGQVGLGSAVSYFSGGNLQAEANGLLRQIAANTRQKKEPTNRSPVPGTGVGIFG